MLTRRDFNTIAQSLRDARPLGHGVTVSDPEVIQWGRDIAAVGQALKSTNPRFDLARFLTACSE